MTDTKKHDGSDSLHELVVCNGVGSDGCGKFCPHSAPHKKHKPKQTAHDGDKPCTQGEWCHDINKMVQCVAHNDKVSGGEPVRSMAG